MTDDDNLQAVVDLFDQLHQVKNKINKKYHPSVPPIPITQVLLERVVELAKVVALNQAAATIAGALDRLTAEIRRAKEGD